MYQYYLFDLDGTLTDNTEGILNSLEYALRRFSIEVEDRSSLKSCIGPPLMETFMERFGLPHSDAVRAVAYYREYYADDGIFQNRVYDGIASVLEELKRRGKRIILATSKPDAFAVRILEHFGLLGFFDFISAATMDETRTNKDDIIEYAIENCHITDRTKAVMVGDRKHDILGAKKCGLDSVGVLYGFGSEEELTAAGAVYVFSGNIFPDFIKEFTV